MMSEGCLLTVGARVVFGGECRRSGESFPSPIFVLEDGFTDVNSSLKISNKMSAVHSQPNDDNGS